MRTLKILLILASLYALTPAQTYDVVISGGRVMDPETRFDATRNVGITNGKIVAITEDRINGKKNIDAKGLVVSPGFIDLHAHGQSYKSNTFQAMDGVTTALELEGGMPFVSAWLKSREGKSLINYGASVAHSIVRAMAMKKYKTQVEKARSLIAKNGYNPIPVQLSLGFIGKSSYESLTSEEEQEAMRLMDEDLKGGALGIGIPIGYYPGGTHSEIFRVYEYAGKRNSIIFTHIREINALPAFQEAIANAVVNGTSVHIVHLNSMSLGKIPTTLKMIENAQKQGLDITTELYPYTAASTSLESSLFDEGWQKHMGITYSDLQWQDTGERLTKETFAKYRKQGGVVIIHLMKPEWIEMGIKAPFTMIASDGMPYAPGAHPRSAGTFSRVLGRYVREKKALSLMDALNKMTLMPAQRLEKLTPSAKKKGRLQVGMDADITVFDPETIIDTATFEDDLSFSKGVKDVLVNGVSVVSEGKVVEGVYPGEALRGVPSF